MEFKISSRTTIYRKERKMKKIFVVIVTVLFFVVITAGCGAPLLPEPTQKTIVILSRCIIGANNGVKISCESATLDYSERKLILESNQFRIGGWYGDGWICDISIDENRLILEIPKDAQYRIWINKQKHILPKIID